ncbi:LOW QUALITY PROTEIN: hypothetical protein CIHG_06644 [Coccidioides immitis H538.4]|uniref:Uncharacterized protein n=3 Tax=Coccidioides immitis TaxID=5501 RepID=A0A0J8QJ08_COCIT|nr:LOW QUALITY PROTEIN: hypothetical protein CIRG_08058 [Coccidioides immitis RMSCC 2394]KMU72364.1 LOW QUALITY PROTEIN: hypothetical protein CISG_03012 [Coccidioides immitis RMSCC 3703]KMU88703.1 LOW QUALITY PROTEIN: hypothetical protein CIHG_06644 [Coccidioides immitis H538.4]
MPNAILWQPLCLLIPQGLVLKQVTVVGGVFLFGGIIIFVCTNRVTPQLRSGEQNNNIESGLYNSLKSSLLKETLCWGVLMVTFKLEVAINGGKVLGGPFDSDSEKSEIYLHLEQGLIHYVQCHDDNQAVQAGFKVRARETKAIDQAME